MKEMTMLELSSVDFQGLAQALEDHSREPARWRFDPRTGAVELEGEPLGRVARAGLIEIEPLPAGVAYGDLQDFTARVRDRRARELLERAIAGRGAFRRFKDTLFEFEELRAAWFAFHDARMRRRALEWLADAGLIDRTVAERETLRSPDPDLPAIAWPFDPLAIAKAVAVDLERLYGPRLRSVILFGSWARGDAHPESDIDLLVVLDSVESRFEELLRMEPILDRHSADNDTVVTAVAVSDKSWQAADRPMLTRAKIEGKQIA